MDRFWEVGWAKNFSAFFHVCLNVTKEQNQSRFACSFSYAHKNKYNKLIPHLLLKIYRSKCRQ